MEEEAEWIYKYAFNSPPVSLQVKIDILNQTKSVEAL